MSQNDHRTTKPRSDGSIYTVLQETYPSTPPVWFAESEETSITNAVQILSNTSGRDNHVCNTFEF